MPGGAARKPIIPLGRSYICVTISALDTVSAGMNFGVFRAGSASNYVKGLQQPRGWGRP